jgi:hypothetical protein
MSRKARCWLAKVALALVVVVFFFGAFLFLMVLAVAESIEDLMAALI